MKHHDEPIPSKAAIAGHPIHPALVSFPIAFLVGALLTDIAFLVTSDVFWSRVSLWLIGAGLATGLLAAAVGFVDFLTCRSIRDHSIAWWHMRFNMAALVMTALNLFLRIGNAQEAIFPFGLVLSTSVAGCLAVSGWLGGEMSFKHKIGVAADEGDAEAVEDTKRHHSYGVGD